jgi:hypothetical protein
MSASAAPTAQSTTLQTPDPLLAQIPYPHADWFRKEVEQIRTATSGVKDLEKLLSESRKEMYTARSDYFAQVKFIIQLFIVVASLSVAATYFTLKESSIQKTDFVSIVASASFIVSAMLLRYGRNVFIATYELYVTAAIFACQLHYAAGIYSNRWFDYVKQALQQQLKLL